MNKYSLTFRDPKIEKQYLQEKWLTSTSSYFTYISLGVVIAFVIRVAMAVITKDYNLFYYKLSMLCYAVIQYLIVKRKPKLARPAFILLNIGIVIINFEQDAVTSLELSNLKGANMMAVNIILLQSGEFIDAAISLTSLLIFRIASTFALKDTMNLTILLTTFLVNIFMFHYLYKYHSARRSQYLLGIVETCWDKVLLQLIHHSYILLKFDYQNFSYNIEKSINFPFSIPDDSLCSLNLKRSQFAETYYFLQKAQVEKNNLQSFIHNEIKKFQITFRDNYNKQIYAKYQNQLILIDFSIFQAQQPIILLQLKSMKRPKLKLFRNYSTGFYKQNAVFIRLLNSITLKLQHNLPIAVLKRQFIFIQQLQSIFQKQLILKTIDINGLVSHLKVLYPEKLISLTEDVIQGKFSTFLNILILLLMMAIDSNSKEFLRISFQRKTQENLVVVELRGSFNISKFKEGYMKLQGQISLIAQQILVSKQCILFVNVRSIIHFIFQSFITFFCRKTLIVFFLFTQLNIYYFTNITYQLFAITDDQF